MNKIDAMKRILKLKAAGYSNKDISFMLGISTQEVRSVSTRKLNKEIEQNEH